MPNNQGRVQGPTILLSSGRYFDVTEPYAPPPTIVDIAYALAATNRWRGQTIQRVTGRHCFYNDAQHCLITRSHVREQLEVLGMKLSETDIQSIEYAALMHELGEVPWGDVSGPFKVLVPDFKAWEKKSEHDLKQYFQVPIASEFNDIIKIIDIRMMATERRDLMASWNPDDYWEYVGNALPYDDPIEPLNSEVAAVHFLKTFDQTAPDGLKRSYEE